MDELARLFAEEKKKDVEVQKHKNSTSQANRANTASCQAAQKAEAALKEARDAL